MAGLDDDVAKRFLKREKMSFADLEEFQRHLKILIDLYKQSSKDAKVYETMLAGVNAQLEKAAKESGASLDSFATSFASTFGRFDKGAAAVTKYSDNVLKSAFSLDKASGTMKFLGMQTNMTASAFTSVAARLNLVVLAGYAIYKAFDWAAKVRQKEMEYVRLAGGTAGGKISESTQYDLKAEGTAIGGELGAAAAEAIAKTVLGERKGGYEALSTDQRKVLTTMQMGEAADMTVIMSKLMKSFGVGAKGPASVANLTDLMLKMGTTANLAKLPLEDYAAAVLDLSDQFVTSGVKITDVENYVASVSSNIGKGQLQIKTAMEFQQTMLQQATTAAGQEPEAIAGVFMRRTYGNLSETTRKTLDEQMTKSSGGKITTFTGTSNPLLLADVVEKLSLEGKIAPVAADFYAQFNKMFAQSTPGVTDQMLKAIVPVLGLEYAKEKQIIAGVTPEKPDIETIRETPKLFAEASMDYVTYISAAGKASKEFTAALTEALTRLKSAATELVPGANIPAVGGRLLPPGSTESSPGVPSGILNKVSNSNVTKESVPISILQDLSTTKGLANSLMPPSNTNVSSAPAYTGGRSNSVTIPGTPGTSVTFHVTTGDSATPTPVKPMDNSGR